MTGKTVSVDPVGAGLAALPTWARHRGIILYAVAPAQRLMDFHDGLQKTEQREYSRSWRPVLESIWSYAAGNDAAWYPISHAIGHYLLSPQNHIEGQDGPNDADSRRGGRHHLRGQRRAPRSRRVCRARRRPGN